MNVVKGLERIILLIAIVSIVPGFMFGWRFTFETLKTVTPEYAVWERKQNAGPLEFVKDEERSSASRHVSTVRKRIMGGVPEKYGGLERWDQIAGGLISAVLAFVGVFSILLGLTKGVARLSVWVASGFKVDGNGG
jgi:hypothetical protein